MTKLIDMKDGQWVLAFKDGYFYPGSDMAEHLELFASDGGGWDGHRASEIFDVHPVELVKPKTYSTEDRKRLNRENVIAAFDTEAEAIAFRDRFHAIGVDTTAAIENEMQRLVAPFAAEKRAEALEAVHASLPHFFGGAK